MVRIATRVGWKNALDLAEEFLDRKIAATLELGVAVKSGVLPRTSQIALGKPHESHRDPGVSTFRLDRVEKLVDSVQTLWSGGIG